MAHAPARRRGNAGNEPADRFLDGMVGQKLGRFFFGRAADLTDHNDGFSLVVLEEQAEVGRKNDHLAVLSDKNFRHETQKAMMSLSEKQRLVFQLKVIQGMRIHEIAQVTGMAEGTVKSHLFRATHFLREALQEWGEP